MTDRERLYRDAADSYCRAAAGGDRVSAKTVDHLAQYGPFRGAVDYVEATCQARLETDIWSQVAARTEADPFLTRALAAPRPDITPAEAEAFARARFGDAVFDNSGPIGRANAVDAAHEWLTAALEFLTTGKAA